MALQQPKRLAERSSGQVGRGSCSHRLLERKMTQMRRRRRGTVGDTEHREAQCHRRSILSTQQSRALQDFTLHSTQTVLSPSSRHPIAPGSRSRGCGNGRQGLTWRTHRSREGTETHPSNKPSPIPEGALGNRLTQASAQLWTMWRVSCEGLEQRREETPTKREEQCFMEAGGTRGQLTPSIPSHCPPPTPNIY